jgi:hypothetical protein
MTSIVEEAPVIARGSVTIDASPETVWATISDIARWPEWNPDVSAAHLNGPLAAGTEFTWKAGPGTIRSTLLQVDPPRTIAWRGETMGIGAVHIWHIEAGDDHVTLSTEESWTGLLPRLLRRPMQRRLDAAIEAGLAAAKAGAEGTR